MLRENISVKGEILKGQRHCKGKREEREAGEDYRKRMAITKERHNSDKL